MLNGHGLDLLAAPKTVRLANPGEEYPKIVVDFGNGPHGGAGIPAGSFLLDGDGRAQPFNEIHIRPVHPFQELASIGREGFHIASLAFGIEGIEGQGGFSGTADPGDHYQIIPGNVDINIFKVVLSSTTN